MVSDRLNRCISEPDSISLSMHPNGVAVVRFPGGTNGAVAPSPGQLHALDRCLTELDRAEGVSGLVLWLSDDQDAGGAAASDTSIRAWAGDHPRSTSQITARLERALATVRRLATGPFVTIAAIEGACTGLSVEMASWCDWRIVCSTPTEAGFRCSHTTRGVVPFLGAVRRLPHIVGLSRAVQTLTGASSIDCQTALRWGLIDEIVSDADRLLAASIQRVRQLTADTSNRRPCGSQPPIPTARAEIEALETRLRQWLVQTDHPSPETAMAVLSLIADVTNCPIDRAIHQIVEVGATHLVNPTIPALAHVSRWVQQFESGQRPALRSARGRGRLGSLPIQTVGICGAGIMGEAIASTNLRSGIAVRIYDASSQTLDQAVNNIRVEIEQAHTDPWNQDQWPGDAVHNLTACVAEAELAACDLLIESIVENRELKQQILGRLEPQMGADAILTSNTSTISVTDLGAALQIPQRFCGLHFCNPARSRQLVEVVRADQTSDATVSAAVRYIRQIGKLPIVVHDRPGFLINRLLLMYLNEAIVMLSQAMPLDKIDRAARAFGMSLGPFELLDLIGIDTAMIAGRTMWETYPDRVALTPVLPALVKRNRFGRKTKVGFYRYLQNPDRGEVDPQLEPILEPYIRPSAPVAEDQIAIRLLLPMVVEATRVLDEQVVSDIHDVDIGTVFGLAFPARRGGLLYWADQVGAATLLQQLKSLEHLGLRMQPTERLKQMAAGGRSFHQSASGT